MSLNDIPASETIDKTAEEFANKGFNVAVSKGDVRSEEDADRLMQTAVDRFGSIDILVNNAGITRDTLIIRMSEKDWDDVLILI